MIEGLSRTGLLAAIAIILVVCVAQILARVFDYIDLTAVQ